MTIEFSKKQNNKETVYSLESITSAAVASVPMPMGGTRTRGGLLAQEADKTPVVPSSKPRNFVAKNATTGGAGAHVDKKRAQKQGNEKHKKPFAESADEYPTEKQIETRIRQIMYDRKLSGTDSNAGELNRLKAELKALRGQQSVAEGSNSSPFNQEQNLRSKSDKELADLIQFWNRALEKNPEHKIAREQLGLIKMIRSERIGKKLAEKTASKDVTEMDNRTPSGDRRERRANSPEAMAQREKELQNNLKKISPELRKKLQLPEPKEGVSEDHEIQMASSELQSIAKNAVNLLDLVRRYSERDGLQAWQQSKITKAADYLNAVLQSISGEQHDPDMEENFKDGRNPGRKGLAKRSGVNTGASVSSLRNTARHSTGEKQRMAHWLANMKTGRAKDEGVEEGSTQKYEMMLRNGQVKKFVAKDDADARRIAAGHSAKSVIRMKGNVPGDKIGEQGVAEAWSQKYKSSINCSHPKGFSQKAHCAGKKKHNEDLMMEMTCPDCGMCETHGNHMMEIKQRLDAKCWKGKHKEGTKIKGGVRVNNCVPNESSDAYVQRLQAHLESTLMEKIPANAPVDAWVQDFQQADPQKYHQFRNKTPEEKAQMAVAASYAAKTPGKKK
jgi:hypothetical protein